VDARSRLTENERAFESTLASIRRQEDEIAVVVERARAAEAKAADALRTAEEERRKGRRERDEAVKAAREEAQRLVAQLRDDVADMRRRLERETVTAPAIDAALARADRTLERLPEASAPEERRAAPAAPRVWRLGDRARSRSGGWEGRIAALEKGGTRATLEAGGMRVSVAVDDLEPAIGSAAGGGAASGGPGSTGSIGARPGPGSSGESASGISGLRLQRARSVASSLDLRGARVDEALDALSRYLDDASLAGLDQVLVIHGMGTGALRDAVRDMAGSHPLVRSFRAGERGEGGDGATIVKL
jgi:DNA mismatch repair protein MutS2